MAQTYTKVDGETALLVTTSEQRQIVTKAQLLTKKTNLQEQITQIDSILKREA